jgi:hypothetical protein
VEATPAPKGEVRIMPDPVFIPTAQGLESEHWLSFPTGDGRLCQVLTGVVKMTVKGDGAAWTRLGLDFSVDLHDLPAGKGLRLDNWTVLVTPNAFSNDKAAVDAGWAVDGFSLADPGSVHRSVTVNTRLAVRDVDGFLLRVGYAIHLVGRLDAWSGPIIK